MNLAKHRRKRIAFEIKYVKRKPFFDKIEEPSQQHNPALILWDMPPVMETKLVVVFLHDHSKNHMEVLFSTELSIDNKNVVYQVHFDNEKYTFFPEAQNKELPSFSFKREHDEWHELELLSPQLKNQA